MYSLEAPSVRLKRIRPCLSMTTAIAEKGTNECTIPHSSYLVRLDCFQG